VNQEISFTTNR